MKHVCPLNVSNIELYLYIIYMLISFLYPYRPTSMCYTQVLYSNIYIAFFLWEKKNNKMVSSESLVVVAVSRDGGGGQDGVLGPPVGGGQAWSGDALGFPPVLVSPLLWWCGSPRSSPRGPLLQPLPQHRGGAVPVPGSPTAMGGGGMRGGGLGLSPAGGQHPVARGVATAEGQRQIGGGGDRTAPAGINSPPTPFLRPRGL